MSKFNFQNLVESLLFEAAPYTTTHWYNKVITHFNKEIIPNPLEDTQNPPINPGTNLGKTFIQGIAGTTQNIKTGSVPLNYISILDLLRNLSSFGVTGSTVQDFINNAESKYTATPPNVKKYIDNWLKITLQSYGPTNKKVVEYVDRMNQTLDQASQAALDTYNDKSIINAVNEIIEKRTNAASKLSALKNPWGSPFVNFIKELFLNPQQYASGTKKVPGDFSQIIDDIYMPTLINVSVAAQTYFKSLNSGVLDVNKYQEFLNNKSNTSSIENIQSSAESGSMEAKRLVELLASIALYQRKTVGAKQRLSYTSQAASSFTSAFGAKTYVGS